MRDMTVVKFFLVKNPGTRVAYVRDSRGFKKGVVVGIDKDHIGWSLISKEDYIGTFMRYDQFPRIQRDMHINGADSITLADMLDDIEYKKLCEDGGYTRVPPFDREEGLHIAINRALKGSVVANVVNEDVQDMIEELNRDIMDNNEFLAMGYTEEIPNDDDLQEALIDMCRTMYDRNVTE